MKILLSALACEPGKGSEPEVGFRTMLAAAARHDVWVLTVPESTSPIRRAIEGDERSSRIRLIEIDFESRGKRLDRLTAAEFHLGYDRWQRHAGSRALQLHRELDFDLAHHVTLASYWTRASVSMLPIPLVWGPIGGGVDPPLRLLGELGLRGLIEASARIVGRPAVAMLPSVRRTQNVASVILAQNIDTGTPPSRSRTNDVALECLRGRSGGNGRLGSAFQGSLVRRPSPTLEGTDPCAP